MSKHIFGFNEFSTKEVNEYFSGPLKRDINPSDYVETSPGSFAPRVDGDTNTTYSSEEAKHLAYNAALDFTEDTRKLATEFDQWWVKNKKAKAKWEGEIGGRW